MNNQNIFQTEHILSYMTELSEEYIKSKLVEKPITDFRDLQYLYGVMSVAAKGLSCDHAAYLTTFSPDDPEGSLVCVDFKWETSSNTLQFDQLTPQSFKNSDKELVEKVSYSSYSASNGSDHSVTQKTPNSTDSDKLKSYIGKTLDWFQKQTIQDFIEESDGVQILEAFVKVSNDEQLIEEIKSEADNVISDPSQCLVTVRIKEENTETYKYPGEFNAFVEALKKRNKSKSVSKTFFKVDSKGEGISSISETQQSLVGCPSDSLDTFKTKQNSTSHQLSNDENSWLSYPVSMEESLHWAASDDILDKMYINIFNRRMYFVPYPTGNPSVQEIKETYELVRDYSSSEFGEQMSFTEHISDAFYVLSVSQENELYNILGELQYVPQSSFTQFGDEFIKQATKLVNKTNLFNGLKPNKNSQIMWIPKGTKLEDWTPTVTHLLNQHGEIKTNKTDIYRKFIYGDILSEVSNGENSEFNESDNLSELYWEILSQGTVSRNKLLKIFVKGIIDKEAELLGKTTQVYSKQTLFHQHTLLNTLQSIGGLNEVTEDLSASNKYDDYMEQTDLYNTINTAVEGISSSRSEQYSFLIGTILGYTAEYQSQERNMNKTLVTDHPINQAKSSKLRQVVTNTLDKTQIYDMYGKSDFGNLARKYQPETDELSKASNDAIKYYYALGLSFGNSLFYSL